MFILWYMPLESRQANLYEVINDCTLLLLTYHLWLFTDVVGEPETRHLLGFAFMAVCLGNVGIHLVTMIVTTGITVKLSCRKRIWRNRIKKYKLAQPPKSPVTAVRGEVDENADYLQPKLPVVDEKSGEQEQEQEVSARDEDDHRTERNSAGKSKLIKVNEPDVLNESDEKIMNQIEQEFNVVQI